MKKIKIFIKKRKFLLLFILVLVGVRIWLPYYLKGKLITSINSVENYSCKIEDLDLSIIRGAMVLQEFEIELTDNNVKKPYVAIKEADISVEWGAVIKGAIVGEIYLDEPVIYFADGSGDGQEQVGDVSWVQPILDFIPLKINRFEIVEGRAEFENITSSPPVNIVIDGVNCLATNLSNAQDQEEELPSEITLTSSIFEKGILELNGKMNILKDIPDMDINIQATNIDLTNLNDFSLAYAAFDFEKGKFAFASELAMKDGEILGYAKPILENVSVFTLKEKGKLLNKFWQAFAGFAIEITENQMNDQSATKVPLSGRYDDPNYNIVATILNVFKNAFFKAYDKKTDNSVNFEDLKDKIKGSEILDDDGKLFSK